ncbi:protein white, partial [Eurytemora carolleeae]|uniref:protein white n=1 Tax=Eurytemora carolleeae TaxID=1294199 RepID=UPI000C75633E
MDNPGLVTSNDHIICKIEKSGGVFSEPRNASVSLKVEKGITFSWSNLSVSTRGKDGSRCCGLIKGKGTPPKNILSNVSGIVRPGELLAIMGASGAGKSTLLNTLLFRNLGDLKISGKRIANESIVTPNNLTALSGYVQQDDLFFGTLTVKEHLTFQALVRMDKEISLKDRLERVEAVLQE